MPFIDKCQSLCFGWEALEADPAVFVAIIIVVDKKSIHGMVCCAVVKVPGSTPGGLGAVGLFAGFNPKVEPHGIPDSDVRAGRNSIK